MSRLDAIVAALFDARLAQAKLARADSPAEVSYLAKLGDRAHAITDSDVEAMRAAGAGEDRIFDLTIAGACQAGRTRWQAARAAIDGARGSKS